MASVETEQHQLIQAKTQSLFQIDLKRQQLQAVHHLLFQRIDLILIGKTGFGKSIIFQAAPLIENSTVILMSLKALQDEHCEKPKHVYLQQLQLLGTETIIIDTIVKR